MQKSRANPNILWITTDQQRYDTIGALGNKYIHTPNLDRLCKEGVAFSKTYCQSPVCTPSRASFLTGLYPSSIHVNRVICEANEGFYDRKYGGWQFFFTPKTYNLRLILEEKHKNT